MTPEELDALIAAKDKAWSEMVTRYAERLDQSLALLDDFAAVIVQEATCCTSSHEEAVAWLAKRGIPIPCKRCSR